MNIPHTRRRWAIPRWHLLVWLTAALTAGCAGVMRVDSQVQTHEKWPPGALSTGEVHYHFERLPSQTGAGAETAPRQTELEAGVAQALRRAQWAPAQPGQPARWQVQVGAHTTELDRARWERSPHMVWMHGLPWKNQGPRTGGFMVVETPYFQRQLSVVVRDTQTAQVVYETTAFHDGRWRDSPALWQAMADAALEGFPHPTQPQRQINIDIAR